MYRPLLPKSKISNIKIFPVVLQTNSNLAPKTCFLTTALTLYRQQCPITLCHKACDLIGLFENAGYIVRKPVFGVSDQVCHNRAVQSLNMARGLKFWIQKVEGFFFPRSENKGADQLRDYREADLLLCFRMYKNPFFFS